MGPILLIAFLVVIAQGAKRTALPLYDSTEHALRARIVLDVFEQLIPESFERFDEVRIMLIEGYEERALLEKFSVHRFLAEVEVTEAEFVKTIKRMKMSDDRGLIEGLDMLPRLASRLVNDLGLIYVPLPRGTRKLDIESNRIRQLTAEMLRTAATVTLLLTEKVGDQLTQVTALVYIKIARQVIGTTRDCVSALIVQASQGPGREYISTHPIGHLLEQVEAHLGLVDGYVKQFEKSPNVQPVLEKINPFIVAVTTLQVRIGALIAALPNTLEDGPISLIPGRRALELRVDEWAMLSAFLSELIPNDPTLTTPDI